MKIFSSKKRVAAIGVVTAATLVGGGMAFAYWTTSGTGTGTATTGTTTTTWTSTSTATATDPGSSPTSPCARSGNARTTRTPVTELIERGVSR